MNENVEVCDLHGECQKQISATVTKSLFWRILGCVAAVYILVTGMQTAWIQYTLSEQTINRQDIYAKLSGIEVSLVKLDTTLEMAAVRTEARLYKLERKSGLYNHNE